MFSRPGQTLKGLCQTIHPGNSLGSGLRSYLYLICYVLYGIHQWCLTDEALGEYGPLGIGIVEAEAFSLPTGWRSQSLPMESLDWYQVMNTSHHYWLSEQYWMDSHLFWTKVSSRRELGGTWTFNNAASSTSPEVLDSRSSSHPFAIYSQYYARSEELMLKFTHGDGVWESLS